MSRSLPLLKTPRLRSHPTQSKCPHLSGLTIIKMLFTLETPTLKSSVDMNSGDSFQHPCVSLSLMLGPHGASDSCCSWAQGQSPGLLPWEEWKFLQCSTLFPEVCSSAFLLAVTVFALAAITKLLCLVTPWEDGLLIHARHGWGQRLSVFLVFVTHFVSVHLTFYKL